MRLICYLTCGIEELSNKGDLLTSHRSQQDISLKNMQRDNIHNSLPPEPRCDIQSV